MSPIVKAAFACAVLAGLMPAAATAFETRATAAYVIDHGTGTVLMSKNADVPLPPASMSKLMTLHMLFEALRDGRVDLDDEFRVSARAAAMGGSSMFLREGERVKVRDLIPGIIVMSGNDACIVVAEALAGTEEDFARMMTGRARALGMENTTLKNATGWPHPEHRMSLHDLAILARRLIEEFPEYYPYFAQKEFAFDNRVPANRFNRNPLLGLGLGVDGLKTGHTQEAGFGLVASAQQGGRRVTFVYSGLATAEDRAQEGERILSWALRHFMQRKLGAAGDEVARAPVWLGAQGSVGLALAEPLEILVPALLQGGVTAEARFAAPVEAPVKAGTVLGELVVQVPELEELRVPLVAAGDVAAGGVAIRLRAAADVVAARLMRLVSEGG